MVRIALLAFEKDFGKLSEVEGVLREFAEVERVCYRRDVWEKLMEYDCVVAYLATGIVVRGACRHLRSKWEDPALIVLDKKLSHAVVLLGGHHGGNEVARLLERCGIEPVITTAMEYSDGLNVGVGFRRQTTAEEILTAIKKALEEVNATIDEVRAIATVEGKEGSAIVKVADMLKKPLVFVKVDDLNSMDLKETKAIKIGVKNVAEGCAIFVSKHRELLLPKTVYGGVTVAIAR